MHQITAEEATQLFFEHAPFFIQQKLPERAGQPLTGRADQCQPVRIGLSERFIGHCILQRARSSKMRQCFPLGESDDDTDQCPARLHRQLHLVVTGSRTRRCAVVDPGDAAPVQAWLAANPHWVLSDILITHHHHDHVGGVER
jgi:hypothetical protein